MPTGTFSADFTSFLSAVDQAEVKLKSFEDGGGRVEASLSRMTNSLSGTTIVQQATIAAEAVERIGGVSQLTQQELARISKIAAEAAEKLTAMGQDVPPGIAKIAEEAHHVTAEHQSMVASLREVAAAFGLVFSVEKVVEFTHQIVEEAHALQVLSLQTGINVHDLQILTSATREYGVEGDQLGRALFQLQQRIAGGDQSVATAFHAMGLTIDEIKNKDPMDLFLTTEHALGELSGAIQDTAAKDLFGGRLGSSMIAFSKGVDEAIGKARDMNKATDDSVKALFEYSNAIERAQTSLKALATESIGGAVLGFEVLSDAAARGAGKWSLFLAVLKDWATSSVVTGANTSNLTALLDSLNQKTDEHQKTLQKTAEAARALDAAGGDLRNGLTIQIGQHVQVAAALTEQEKAQRFMAATELDSAKPILGWQAEYLAHLKEIGLLTAQNAAAIGVNTDQLKRYEEGLAAAAKEAAEWTKLLEEAAVAETKNHNLAMKHQTEIRAENEKTAQQRLTLVNGAILAELEAQIRLNAAQGLDASGAIAHQQTALEKLTLALTLLHTAEVAGISQKAQEQELTDKYTKSLYDEAVAQDAARDALVKENAELAKVPALKQAAAVSYSAQSIFSLDPNNPGSWDTKVKSFNNPGAQVAYDSFHNPYVYIPGVNAAPGRAGGGDVSADMPYLVGERGPELFVPKTSGSILPSGGGVMIGITINGSVLGNKEEIARVVGDALQARLRALGTQLPVGI